MTETIEQLCKKYLPNGRDLSTFKEKEILHLESAFVQGATVMMHYLKGNSIENEASEEPALNIADVVGSDLPKNDNPDATCKLDFNRSACKHQTQNYGCNNKVNCMYKMNKF